MKKCLAFFPSFRETRFGFSSPYEKLPLIRCAISIKFFHVHKKELTYIWRNIFLLFYGEKRNSFNWELIVVTFKIREMKFENLEYNDKY